MKPHVKILRKVNINDRPSFYNFLLRIGFKNHTVILCHGPSLMTHGSWVTYFDLHSHVIFCM